MEVQELQVECNHKFVIYGLERMVLVDSATQVAIALADRTGGHTWTVSAPNATGIAEVTTADRGEAVTAMLNVALSVGDQTGYSTFEPTYVIDGATVELRDLP